MKKYKLLKFGRFYINRIGDFAITLLGGCKKNGYIFAGSNVNPCYISDYFQLQSRIVDRNDWFEIRQETFERVMALHSEGYVLKVSGATGRSVSEVSKIY